MFEYFLITGEMEVKLEESESYKVLFHDMFSKTYSYLKKVPYYIQDNIGIR